MTSADATRPTPATLSRPPLLRSFNAWHLRTAINALLAIFLAREMGASDFGLLAASVAVVVLLSVVVGLGLDAIVRKELAATPAEAPMILGTAMALRVAAAALVYAAVLFFGPSSGSPNRSVWLIASLSLFVQAPLTLTLWLESIQQKRWALIAENGAFGVSTLLRIFLIASQVPAGWFVATLALESTIAALVVFFVHGHHAPNDDSFSWDPIRALRWAKSIWPTVALSLGALVLVPLNQIIVALVSTPAEAGKFAVGLIPVLIGVVILRAVLPPMRVLHLATLRALPPPEKDAPPARPLVPPVVRALQYIWIALLVLGGAALWIVPIVFGNEYKEGAVAFLFLLASLLPLALGAERHDEATSWDERKRLLIAYGCGFVFNIGVGCVLAAQFGATGAAAATLASVMFSSIVTSYFWSDGRVAARSQWRNLFLVPLWESLKKPEQPKPKIAEPVVEERRIVTSPPPTLTAPALPRHSLPPFAT
jgi:O-antigen/teichoic acid export membrane protein